MNKILLSAAAFLMIAGSASAATLVTGSVQSYDAASRVVTLESGEKVALGHVVAPAGLVRGAKVTVILNENSNEVISVLIR